MNTLQLSLSDLVPILPSLRQCFVYYTSEYWTRFWTNKTKIPSLLATLHYFLIYSRQDRFKLFGRKYLNFPEHLYWVPFARLKRKKDSIGDFCVAFGASPISILELLLLSKLPLPLPLELLLELLDELGMASHFTLVSFFWIVDISIHTEFYILSLPMIR